MLHSFPLTSRTPPTPTSILPWPQHGVNFITNVLHLGSIGFVIWTEAWGYGAVSVQFQLPKHQPFPFWNSYHLSFHDDRNEDFLAMGSPMSVLPACFLFSSVFWCLYCLLCLDKSVSFTFLYPLAYIPFLLSSSFHLLFFFSFSL